MSHTPICKDKLFDACQRGIDNIEKRRKDTREARIKAVLDNAKKKKWPFRMFYPKNRKDAIKWLDKEYFNSDWYFIVLFDNDREDALVRLRALARCADEKVMLSAKDALFLDGYLDYENT